MWIRIILVSWGIALGGGVAPADAQTDAQTDGQDWIQIEAHRDRDTAAARAAAFARSLPNVTGFVVGNGWHAVALGPYPDTAAAQADLRRLRASGLIPRDSYLTRRGDYRDGFWSGGAPIAAIPAAPMVPPAEPAAAAAATRAETRADAERAERALSREDKQHIQRALTWTGQYAGAIDGSFGPATRRAIAAWQTASGHAPTGVLRSAERRALLETVQAEQARLGLAEVTEDAAGIGIVLPLGLVRRAEVDAPFVRYQGAEGVEVLLLSQPGDERTLRSYFDILQALQIVPLDGPRAMGDRSFSIEATNGATTAVAYGVLADDTVKGYVLSWPAALDGVMARVPALLRESFSPLPGAVLPRVPDPQTGDDLMAGVALRQPERVLTGVFVDATGTVLTLASGVDGCARVMIDAETEARPAATWGELALIVPQSALAPRSHGVPGPVPAQGDAVVSAGYPWGGRLGAPSVNAGSVMAPDGLSGLSGTLLEMAVETSEAGAPVLDQDGRLVGLLRYPMGARSLPPGIAVAVPADDLARFLEEALVRPTGLETPPADDRALAEYARGMAALVTCWTD